MANKTKQQLLSNAVTIVGTLPEDDVRFGVRYVGINSSLLPELEAQYEERVSNELVFSGPNNKVLQIANFKRNHFNSLPSGCKF
ncbi:MAG: hypothetical protein HQM16_13005 [Deltaproteobacteria bacterium]|nr:hypothetical protein [Deltaproteobacteria bacterium]